MRATALELPARWGHPAEALAEADALLARAPTELALLPEAALTGYVSPEGDFDLRPFAEPLDGPSARALAELARKHRTHLVGPLVERDGERCFNAVVGFSPDGARFLHYRKRHPWYPEAWATPGGQAAPLVEVGGLTVTCAICFDVHTLADDAAAALEAADLLLFPSAWVDDGPDDARGPLFEGLRRRFGVHVVNANWAPGVVRLWGQGGSRIVRADGAVARAAAGRVDLTLAPGPAAR